MRPGGACRGGVTPISSQRGWQTFTPNRFADTLKTQSAGKVIVVPTGWALEDKFLTCGIRDRVIPAACCQLFKQYLLKKLLVDQV